MNILLILMLLFFIVPMSILNYKFRQEYYKKYTLKTRLFHTLISIVLVVIYVSYENYSENSNNDELAKAFKKKYEYLFSYKIKDIYKEEVWLDDANRYVYHFKYVLKKNNKEYTCYANNISVDVIDGEYYFYDINEKCE